MSSFLPRRRAVLLTFGAAALGTACDSATSPAPRVPATPQIHAIELKMHQLVNRDRASKGKPALAYDERLADIARGHAADMRDAHFFAHDSPRWGTLDDRIARAKLSIVTARENLAEAVDVDDAQRSLMASPGHFENLMADDVTHVGVGVVKGGVENPNMLLFVQVFARTVTQESPEEAKAIVLAKITKARAARGRSAPVLHETLDDLAEKYVDDVDDEMGRSSLDRAGTEILDELKRAGVTSLAVVVSGQRVVAASEYEPSPTMLEKQNLSLGIGAAAAKDERGRPAVKILVLMGA